MTLVPWVPAGSETSPCCCGCPASANIVVSGIDICGCGEGGFGIQGIVTSFTGINGTFDGTLTTQTIGTITVDAYSGPDCETFEGTFTRDVFMNISCDATSGHPVFGVSIGFFISEPGGTAFIFGATGFTLNEDAPNTLLCSDAPPPFMGDGTVTIIPT